MLKEYLLNFDIEKYIWFWLLSAFLLAFVISHLSNKPLIRVVREKRFFDNPNDRSSHKSATPTLGGLMIYISTIIALSIYGSFFSSGNLLLLLGCITWLFLIGIYDDLTSASAAKKALIQLIASLFIIIISDVRIDSLFGIFGVDTLNYWVSIIFTVFIYLLIINAYNLIDGIDGLSAGHSVMVCLAFSYIFFNFSNILLTVSVILIGAILPFLRYNLSNKKKIFMGDSGSIVIGFLISYLSVNYLNVASFNNTANAPVIIGSILFFPLMDTLRIFFIRIFVHKKSPFVADNNHLHHKFLELGFNHKQTTAIIILLNILIVIFAFNLPEVNINLQIVLLVLFGTIMFSLIFIYNFIKNRLQ